MHIVQVSEIIAEKLSNGAVTTALTTTAEKKLIVVCQL
jgi:hypothetical protein